jgi:hypothetical protein
MANIHSLSDLKKRAKQTAGSEPPRDEFYAGGIGSDGGGSGVAIQMPGGGDKDPMAAIVRRARPGGGEGGSGGSGGAAATDTHVELYGNGFFVVHQGKRGDFRFKTDPANESFLSDLKRGEVPTEVAELTGQTVRFCTAQCFAWL